MIQLFQSRVLHVSKKTILSIIILTFISCQNKSYDNDDYLIINDILSSGSKEQTLNPNKTNEPVVSILEKLNTYESNGDNLKLDSLRQSIGILKEDDLLNSIFNEKEYNYLIAQKCIGTWGKNILNKFNNKGNEHSKAIEVSKPIYLKGNNIALVSVNKQTTSCIYIYKKDSINWSFYKVVAPTFKQPKAETFIK